MRGVGGLQDRDVVRKEHQKKSSLDIHARCVIPKKMEERFEKVRV